MYYKQNNDSLGALLLRINGLQFLLSHRFAATKLCINAYSWLSSNLLEGSKSYSSVLSLQQFKKKLIQVDIIWAYKQLFEHNVRSSS